MTSTLRRALVSALTVAVLASACGGGDDDDSDATSDTTSASGTTAPTESTEPAGELGRGVTADTIKIGFSYIDLATLAEAGVIRVSHGDYEKVITALVDDVNANGGVNGRTLELVTAKYSPIGNEEQLAACTKLTEDDQVFAVLNGFLTDNQLCVVEQHETALVGGYMNNVRLDRARAPWASVEASEERAISALIQGLDENGELDGKTIAVYAAQAVNTSLIDLAVEELEAAGYEVADTALLDVPDDDTQAAAAQNTVFAQRMMDQGVDTVVVVGSFIPGADFDAAGFHPSLFTANAGNIAAAAFTNPLGNFPMVAGIGGPPDIYDNTDFTRCRQVYEDATGETILTPTEEDVQGESTGYTAMAIACSDLTLFVAAAEAAGEILNNETFAQGLASLTQIDLAQVDEASFGPDKHDGQDTFTLQQFDPAWEEGSGEEQFTMIGEPFVLG